MASPCPRCRRYHSGPCGIPGRPSIDATGSATRFPVSGKPRATPRSRATLRGLLTWGEREYKQVMKLLKVIPQDVALLEREGQLANLIKQVQGQLVNLKGGGSG